MNFGLRNSTIRPEQINETNFNFNNLFENILQYDLKELFNRRTSDQYVLITKIHQNTNAILQIFIMQVSSMEYYMIQSEKTNEFDLKYYGFNSNFDAEILFQMLMNYLENLEHTIEIGHNEYKTNVLVKYNIDKKTIKLSFNGNIQDYSCDYYVFRNNLELQNYLGFPTPSNKQICFSINY